MKTMDFKVNGMSCGHCVKTITNSLKSLAGVQDVNVSLEQKKVTVTFEEAKLDQDVLKGNIAEAGYEVV